MTEEQKLVATVIGSVAPTRSLEWNPDFTATRDEKNMWTGSESFTCKLDEVSYMLPSTGAPCELPGWSFLKTSSITITNIEGTLCSVGVKYGGFNSESETASLSSQSLASDSLTSTSLTGNALSSDSLSSGEQPNPDPTNNDKETAIYDLSISVSQEPIESHIKFLRVSMADRQVIADVKNGKLKELKGTPYAYKDSSDHGDATVFKIVSGLGQQLMDYINKGILNYEVPNQIWRKTYTDNKLPNAATLNAVGKITTASNAPAVSSNRSWLFMGCTVSQDAQTYTITLEWKLSGPGGWDIYLYTS